MESKAAESYRAFESLRNRFGEAKSSRKFNVLPSRLTPKGRTDPRSNAPPLVPLVEEGDQVQATLFHERRDAHLMTSPVKGKWRNSHYRSNHLNGPDFDSLETSSVASGSSAYSSKEDSLSPTYGSITELSDVGSMDSFLEYDFKRNQAYHRTATLKATFEQWSPTKSREMSDEYVQHHTKAWNRVIGEWVFEGIPASFSPKMELPGMRPPSNEIRFPTPLSTPQFGSTENLIDSESPLSSGGENEDTREAKYKLGEFVNSTRGPLMGKSGDDKQSKTDQPKALDSESLLSNSGENEDTREAKYKLGEFVNSTRGPLMDKPGDDKHSKMDQPKGTSTPSHQSSDESHEEQSRSQAKSGKTNKWAEALQKYRAHKKAELNIDTDKSQTTSSTRTSQWSKAYEKYKQMKVKQVDTDVPQSPEQPQSTAEEPAFSSVVQTAKLFGGTKRGLRRTQSLHASSHRAVRIARFRKELSIDLG